MIVTSISPALRLRKGCTKVLQSSIIIRVFIPMYLKFKRNVWLNFLALLSFCTLLSPPLPTLEKKRFYWIKESLFQLFCPEMFPPKIFYGRGKIIFFQDVIKYATTISKEIQSRSWMREFDQFITTIYNYSYILN